MAYRRTRAVELQQDEKRQRILNAVKVHFEHEGFSNFSMARIAFTSRVAVGTLYRYFPSKTELMLDFISGCYDTEIKVLRSIASLETTPLDRLHKCIATFVQRAMKNRRLSYALISEACDPAIEELRCSQRHSFFLLVRGFIQEALAQDLASTSCDPDITAAVITGGVMEALCSPSLPINLVMGCGVFISDYEMFSLAERTADICCSLLSSALRASPLPPEALTSLRETAQLVAEEQQPTLGS